MHEKWIRNTYSDNLSLAKGNIRASVSWAVTGKPGYVVRVNEWTVPENRRPGDIAAARRIAETYIKSMLYEAVQQMGGPEFTWPA